MPAAGFGGRGPVRADGGPKKRSRAIASNLVSVLVHVGLLGSLFAAWGRYAPPPEPEAIEVSLVPLQTLSPDPPAPKPAPARVEKPVRKTVAVRKTPPARAVLRKVVQRPSPVVQTAPGARSVDFGPGLSESALIGAADAGSGGGGGGSCNMAARLQAGLLKDPVVQRALANLDGKAILVWNGAWVRFTGEDGAGLSAVREAVMWEIAFAPQACQDQEMRGLLVLKAGRGRIALGAPAWRWANLVTRHKASGGFAP